jgi:exosortase E/protease (VPEID-CTERM system)
MACILALECLLVTDLPHPWLASRAYSESFSHPWWEPRTYAESIILFFAALLFFGRDKLRQLGKGEILPVRRTWAVAHVGVLWLFCATNLYLLHKSRSGVEARGALLAWYATICLLPITLGGASFGLRRLLSMLGGLGGAWGLAALCCALMTLSRYILVTAWDAPNLWLGRAMQSACFLGVKTLLGLFYSGIVADPANHVLGTKAFEVQISGPCSGIDGLALMVSLTGGWLVYSRRELRMGRALLLMPVSLVLIWLLNLMRVTALIAIGDAGYGSVAIGGFHSEAGWILFSCVALGFLLTVNHVSWFRIARPALADGGSEPKEGLSVLAETNIAAVYLMPFLAILAAGLVSVAVSDGFEWLYGIRLVAALGVLYAYRRQYRRMDWRFGWLGPAAGVAVFAIWIGLDRWMGHGEATAGVPLTSIADGLARLSSAQRTAWIAVRTIAAVVTVPVAEELAFRGYLARRLISTDVESVPYAGLSRLAIVGSSLAFGALHGRMWVAGVLAGVAFALVARIRGRLGEAVAAHATANLLIAVWVLASGDYSLW